MTQPTILRKSYTEPYVLDRGKLSRIMTIVEQRLAEAEAPFNPAFVVTLKNEKEIVLHTVQEVLSLDNSVKNPIRIINIITPLGAEEGATAAPRVELRFDSDRSHNITLAVSSPDAKFANELFAELEEQIDRTVVRNWIPRYLKSGRLSVLLAFASLILMSVMVGVISSDPPRRQLSSTDVAELSRTLSTAATDSEKIDGLVQIRLRELNATNSGGVLTRMNWSAILTRQGVFIALPILVLIGTLVYMIVVCYPWSAFSWGDYEQHYAALVARRKTLGTVVVASLVIGVLGNLFAASIPTPR